MRCLITARIKRIIWRIHVGDQLDCTAGTKFADPLDGKCNSNVIWGGVVMRQSLPMIYSGAAYWHTTPVDAR